VRVCVRARARPWGRVETNIRRVKIHIYCHFEEVWRNEHERSASASV